MPAGRPMLPCHFCGGERTEILSMSIKNMMLPACRPCKTARRTPTQQRTVRRAPCAECLSPRTEEKPLSLQRNGRFTPVCATCHENLKHPQPKPLQPPTEMIWGILPVQVYPYREGAEYATCRYTLRGTTKVRRVPIKDLRGPTGARL